MTDWPVLKTYDSEHLTRIALPLGGIGTGTISLGGRGDLRDWEVVNRPAKGFTPERAFFALRVQSPDGTARTRALEGPLDVSAYEGAFGSTAKNHGLPRFRQASFEAAYPFGQILLSDPQMPVTVRLQAFNPLIPGDSARSGIPAAILRYCVTNTASEPLTLSLCGSVPNFIGQDGTQNISQNNQNLFRQTGEVTGILMRSEGVDPQAETWGTMALSTLSTEGVSYRTDWAHRTWGDALLDFWDDFSDDGRLEERENHSGTPPTASLAVTFDLPAGASRDITFLLTWHFPNRMTWTPKNSAASSNWIGNFYTTQYRDAWDVAKRTAADLPQLEADTLAFVRAFCDSDLPDVVKEAALFNLSTLRSQTYFRTADGRFLGWEGCGDKSGCCHGSCSHVFNYEAATAFLFGDLSRSLREVEFSHATAKNGLMSFRVDLPLDHAQDWGVAAADGQMGCLMKLCLDWRLSGDTEFLRGLWPHAKRALEFCWIPGGWDADQDGVMEGCQHNTMDVEYYGPNPQMGGWYLGALRACEEMAHAMGEDDFAQMCHALFERGSRWMDAHLFNGEYYEHEIRPVSDAGQIAPGLRHNEGAQNLADPELQLGPGCLVDQLVGQYMAHLCGLGYLLAPAHVQTTLQSLMRYNFQADLYDHFNHLRTFALQEESAMLMATYPHGDRPPRPFPYYNEVMTGFEYTAAVGMLQEGQTDSALRVMQAIRDRYDGRKRSPFDEAECGHHYSRAMTSWSAVLALSGFHWDGVAQTVRFRASTTPCRWFWSNGAAWGTCQQTPGANGIEVTVWVGAGTLTLQQLELAGRGTVPFSPPSVIAAGRAVTGTVP